MAPTSAHWSIIIITGILLQFGGTTGRAQTVAARTPGQFSCTASETADHAALQGKEIVNYQDFSFTLPPVIMCFQGLQMMLADYVDAYRRNDTGLNLGDVTQAEQDAFSAEAKYFRDQGRPWSHDVSFAQAYGTDRVISLLGSISTYTGGAHGNRYFDSVLYDTKTDAKVELAQLFRRGAPYLQVLAQAARVDLYRQKRASGWLKGADKDPFIDDGTKPKPANFIAFTLYSTADGKAGGIELHFAPYQVGAYGEGDFHVKVPVKLLARHLTPSARGYFE